MFAHFFLAIKEIIDKIRGKSAAVKRHMGKSTSVLIVTENWKKSGWKVRIYADKQIDVIVK